VDETAEFRTSAWSNFKPSAHSCERTKTRTPLFGGMKKFRVPHVGEHFGTPSGVGRSVNEAIELPLTDRRQRGQNQDIKKGAPGKPHAPKVRSYFREHA
jgi:hypothetical protein